MSLIARSSLGGTVEGRLQISFQLTFNSEGFRFVIHCKEPKCAVLEDVGLTTALGFTRRSRCLRQGEYPVEQQILDEHVDHLSTRVIGQSPPQRSLPVATSHSDIDSLVAIENHIDAGDVRYGPPIRVPKRACRAESELVESGNPHKKGKSSTLHQHEDNVRRLAI